jgi:hypothetical protein
LFEKRKYDQARRILLPDEADFSQEYWMSFKKIRGSMAAKGPPVGHIDNFQTGPIQQRANFLYSIKRV